MRVTVAACQVPVDLERPDSTAIRDAVQQAADTGARLVVLPEQALAGSCFSGPEEAAAAAEPAADGPSVTLFRELSVEHGCVLVGGYLELGESGRLHNSAVVVDDGQVLDNYRKVHLWGPESTWCTPGDHPPRAVETSVGNVATMVCYDLEIPEWVRLAALGGADVIAAPCNWPLLVRPADEKPLEVIKAQAAAGTNKVPVVVADRCGQERGVDWIGGSCVVDASGYLLAGPATAYGDVASPVVVHADLDMSAARDKRLDTYNNAFGDRRPELYTGLTITPATASAARKDRTPA